jgi:DNA-binding transcriptional MerR regulator
MNKAETAYRTIAEVSDLLQVQPSVLRFWESQFHQVKPTKRMGRRYYNTEDVVLLARIRDLLYKEGFTIKGVQKKLREKVDAISTSETSQSDTPKMSNQQALDNLIRELDAIKNDLKGFIE